MKNRFMLLVAILIAEMVYFYFLVHNVHTTDEVLFIITVIVVTLVLGVTGIFALKRE